MAGVIINFNLTEQLITWSGLPPLLRKKIVLGIIIGNKMIFFVFSIFVHILSLIVFSLMYFTCQY